jgi:hemoglobin
MTETSHVEQIRARKRAEAAAVGIDDALIDALVERFYATCRRDALLGPIFERHVADWPVHMARLKDFWAAVTLEPGRYRGNPMMKHIAVGGLDAQHFERWLQLWHETIAAVVPNEAAAGRFRDAAERIATSLLMGIRVQRDEATAGSGTNAGASQFPKDA